MGLAGGALIPLKNSAVHADVLRRDACRYGEKPRSVRCCHLQPTIGAGETLLKRNWKSTYIIKSAGEISPPFLRKRERLPCSNRSSRFLKMGKIRETVACRVVKHRGKGSSDEVGSRV